MAASEAAYRTARQFVCMGRGFGAFVPDLRFGWTHARGSEGWSYGCTGRSFEFRNWVRINSAGLHDTEHAYEKTPSTPRVLVLGDSVTEAYQVPFEQSYVRLLEKRLSPVEIVNAGHAGFGTDNQVLFFETEGLRYRPDLVVSALNLQNDVTENSERVYRRTMKLLALPKPTVTLDAGGRAVIDTTPFEQFALQKKSSLSRWLSDNLFVFRAVSRLAARPGGGAQSGVDAICQIVFEPFAVPPDADWEDGWAKTEALYRRLRDAVAASGSRMLVAVIPAREAVDESTRLGAFACARPGIAFDFEMPRRRALAMLDRLGIEHVDTTEALRAAAAGGDAYFRNDPHPNAHGHAAIADAVAEPLSQALR